MLITSLTIQCDDTANLLTPVPLHLTHSHRDTGVFPNCTILDFEQHVIDLLDLAAGRAISFNPVVDVGNRADFETYAKVMAETEPTAFGGARSVKERNAGSRIVADGIYCICSVDGGERKQQDEP